MLRDLPLHDVLLLFYPPFFFFFGSPLLLFWAGSFVLDSSNTYTLVNPKYHVHITAPCLRRACVHIARWPSMQEKKEVRRISFHSMYHRHLELLVT